MKPKFLTVIGTRPELIRLSSLIPLLDQVFDHKILHTGQNSDRQLRDVFFDELDIRTPDYSLVNTAGSLAGSIASTLIGVEKACEEFRPEGMLVLGDTNSALSTIIAKRMQIVTYHWEAGNRSFDANVPEELNRRIVDHTADFNIAYSEAARRNLLSEGLSPRRVFVSGSPMRQVLEAQESKASKSDVLQKLNLETKGFLLVSFHRQENVDVKERLGKLVNAMDSLSVFFDMPVLVSTHPRTQKRLGEFGISPNDERVRFLDPFGYNDYLKLQNNAFCVVSDSGSISEEASILGFPAVTIRNSMERPEALEAGSIFMVDLEAKSIIRGIETALALGKRNPPSEYLVQDAAQRVLAIISSTIGNHKFWDGIRDLDVS